MQPVTAINANCLPVVVILLGLGGTKVANDPILQLFSQDLSLLFLGGVVICLLLGCFKYVKSSMEELLHRAVEAGEPVKLREVLRRAAMMCSGSQISAARIKLKKLDDVVEGLDMAVGHKDVEILRTAIMDARDVGLHSSMITAFEGLPSEWAHDALANAVQARSIADLRKSIAFARSVGLSSPVLAEFDTYLQIWSETALAKAISNRDFQAVAVVRSMIHEVAARNDRKVVEWAERSLAKTNVVLQEWAIQDLLQVLGAEEHDFGAAEKARGRIAEIGMDANGALESWAKDALERCAIQLKAWAEKDLNLVAQGVDVNRFIAVSLQAKIVGVDEAKILSVETLLKKRSQQCLREACGGWSGFWSGHSTDRVRALREAIQVARAIAVDSTEMSKAEVLLKTMEDKYRNQLKAETRATAQQFLREACGGRTGFWSAPSVERIKILREAVQSARAADVEASEVKSAEAMLEDQQKKYDKQLEKEREKARKERHEANRKPPDRKPWAEILFITFVLGPMIWFFGKVLWCSITLVQGARCCGCGCSSH